VKLLLLLLPLLLLPAAAAAAVVADEGAFTTNSPPAHDTIQAVHRQLRHIHNLLLPAAAPGRFASSAALCDTPVMCSMSHL
jgi:hypothetical protein